MAKTQNILEVLGFTNITLSHDPERIKQIVPLSTSLYGDIAEVLENAQLSDYITSLKLVAYKPG